MKRLRLAVALSALVALLALSPVAFAADSTVDGHGGAAGEVQSTVTDDGGGGSSTLPFTGLDAGFVLGAGALLLAGGLGLRRVTAGRNS
jgi:hypothetical protein